MKLISTLTVAALMSAGAAFAATTPAAPTTPTATPVPSATPADKHTGMRCEKEAKEKNLTGDAEKKFVKDCRAEKKPA